MMTTIRSIITGFLLVAFAGLPAFAAENVKSFAGVAKANTKSLSGVTEANIKSVAGVDNTGGGGYTANSTVFDGTNSWLERDADWTGATDGKTFTISLWLKPNTTATTCYLYEGTQSRITIWLNTSTDKIRMEFKNTSGTMLVQLDQSAGFGSLASGTWYHIMASVDKSVEGRAHLYINNTECCTITTFLSDDVDGNTDNIDRTETDHSVGSYVGGSFYLNGTLAEVFVAYEYLDLSNSTNRAKFYNAGSPVDLGSDGSTPTGTAPICYLKSVYSSFTTNSGTGGNMVKKGTVDFTAGSGPP
jgi:hypothetical protein